MGLHSRHEDVEPSSRRRQDDPVTRAAQQVIEWVEMYRGKGPSEARHFADSVAASGGTPLLVSVHDWNGLGGLVLPFVGIKLIDLLVSMVPGLG